MNKFETFKEIYISQSGKIKPSIICKKLGVSRPMIYRYIYKIKNGKYPGSVYYEKKKAVLDKIYDEVISISKKLESLNK